MLTGLSLALWYGAIAARIVILVLIIKRKFPAVAWFVFLAAHAARSLALVRLQHDPVGYAELWRWTSPWMSGLATLATVEAFVIVCWTIPRFRVPALILAALFAVLGAFLGWLSMPDVNRATGIGLAVFLGLAVTVLDRFSDTRAPALYHASAIGICGLAAAAMGWAIGAIDPPGPALISSGGTLAAYILWIVTVRGMDFTRRTPDPGDAKAEMEQLRRAAGM